MLLLPSKQQSQNNPVSGSHRGPGEAPNPLPGAGPARFEIKLPPRRSRARCPGKGTLSAGAGCPRNSWLALRSQLRPAALRAEAAAHGLSRAGSGPSCRRRDRAREAPAPPSAPGPARRDGAAPPPAAGGVRPCLGAAGGGSPASAGPGRARAPQKRARQWRKPPPALPAAGAGPVRRQPGSGRRDTARRSRCRPQRPRGPYRSAA